MTHDPPRSRARTSGLHLRLQGVIRTSRDDPRLAPRLATPLPEGNLAHLSEEAMASYLAQLARSIVQQRRVKASLATLKDVERIYRFVDNSTVTDADELEALHMLRVRAGKAHNAWRRRHLDDRTMYVVQSRMDATRNRADFGPMADFFAALLKRIQIDQSVAEWRPEA